MTNDIKVCIFEDNYLLRDGYYQLINGTPGFACTGVYENAADLLFKIRHAHPDVVLMDIDLPGIDGIEAAALIKANFPEIHIVMQTVFEDDDKLFRAIQAGAEGYILKKTPPVKILDAIAEVHCGGAPMTPSIAARTLQLFRSGMRPAADKTEAQLNPRQQEILESIVTGMSYRLIGEKYFISVETVRYHVKNIYEILQVHSRYELMAKRRRP